MNNFLRVAGVAAMVAFGGSAQAATILWSTPVNATGNASDILTTGTLHVASTSGPTTTLNGVTFTSGFGSLITLSGVETVTSIYSNPNFGNASYNDLVGTGDYSSSGAPFSITISGLTTGNQYAVQLFEPFWNNNWATAFTGGASTSGLVNLTGPDQGAGEAFVPQFVIGTFTASGTSQLITLSSPTAFVLVAAGQVRDITVGAAVPEPGTWALMIAGFGMIGFAARRKAALVA
ncbi:MAG: PEPxxWA-CTERM sorting domain-containing protein [Polymorphobacter sp.]